MREHHSVESDPQRASAGRSVLSEANESRIANQSDFTASTLNSIHAAGSNRSSHRSSSHLARSILQLQRSHGNRYVQRALALNRHADGSGAVAPDVESSIERARGGGQSMHHGVQQQMESAFGSDFSGVRIHTGPEAHSLNRAVNAVAFTTGQDIFFRDGAYDPASSNGKELLAHELTHVVQQGGNQIATSPANSSHIERMCSHCAEEEKKKVHPKLAVGEPDSQYEREAEEVSRNVSNFLNQQPTGQVPDPARGSTGNALQAAQAEIAQGGSTIELIPDRPFQEHSSNARSSNSEQHFDVVHIAEAVTTRNGVSRRISLSNQPDAWVSRKMNWKDTACKAACWAAGGAIAALVSVACAAGTTFTLGGLAIPCTAAILAAAGAAGAGASVCGDLCDNALATPANQTSSAQGTGDPSPDNAVTTADGTPVPVPDNVPEEATA